MQLQSCTSCKHFDSDSAQVGRFRCEAFPDRIPDFILDGEDDHKTPVEGDHGIQWEQWVEVPEWL